MTRGSFSCLPFSVLDAQDDTSHSRRGLVQTAWSYFFSPSACHPAAGHNIEPFSESWDQYSLVQSPSSSAMSNSSNVPFNESNADFFGSWACCPCKGNSHMPQRCTVPMYQARTLNSGHQFLHVSVIYVLLLPRETIRLSSLTTVTSKLSESEQ